MPSAGDVATVVLIVLAGVLVWFALSPFETLGWWAGWFGDRIYWPAPPDASETHSKETLCHIVFLECVSLASGGAGQ